MNRLVLSLVLVALLASAGLAQEAPPAAAPATPLVLPQRLALLRDGDAGTHAKTIEGILADEPDLAAILEAFAAGLPAPDVRTGWHVIRATDANGVARPCHILVPESVAESTEPAPLLVDMHGGVSRPEFIPDEAFTRFRGAWSALAEEHRFVVAKPIARADCVWWADAGVAHVRAAIRAAKRLAPVDDDRVVGSGFSDGGSGCYYLAMAAPDPFAAFMPMNGHPGVAVSGSGRQLYLENMRLVPLFVAMTQDDGLYPARSVLPHILRLIETGGKAHLVSYPTGGHRPSYFEDQKTAFARFITTAVREPLPRRVSWRTAEPVTGRVRWVEILETGASEGDADEPDEINVMSRPGRVLLGITVRRDFAGPGAAVDSVSDESPAAAMGMKPGDVIRRLDETEVESLGSLRDALSGKRYGDAVTVAVDRGEKRLVLEGRFRKFTPRPVYPRARPTARFDLEVAKNRVTIVSRNVRRFRLLLSPEIFSMAEEVVVVVNGVERARQAPEVSVKALLERYAVEADARRLFPASIEVTLPAAK